MENSTKIAIIAGISIAIILLALFVVQFFTNAVPAFRLGPQTNMPFSQEQGRNGTPEMDSPERATPTPVVTPSPNPTVIPSPTPPVQESEQPSAEQITGKTILYAQTEVKEVVNERVFFIGPLFSTEKSMLVLSAPGVAPVREKQIIRMEGTVEPFDFTAFQDVGIEDSTVLGNQQVYISGSQIAEEGISL